MKRRHGAGPPGAQAPRRVLCTTCTADKDPAPGLLAAARRYRGPRVDHAVAEAARQGIPLYFFSGHLGVVGAEEPIPCYDHALRAGEVAEIARTAARQLRELGVGEITAFLRDRDTPGWAPYHDALGRACALARVTLRLVVVDLD